MPVHVQSDLEAEQKRRCVTIPVLAVALARPPKSAPAPWAWSPATRSGFLRLCFLRCRSGQAGSFRPAVGPHRSTTVHPALRAVRWSTDKNAGTDFCAHKGDADSHRFPQRLPILAEHGDSGGSSCILCVDSWQSWNRRGTPVVLEVATRRWSSSTTQGGCS